MTPHRIIITCKARELSAVLADLIARATCAVAQPKNMEAKS